MGVGASRAGIGSGELVDLKLGLWIGEINIPAPLGGRGMYASSALA